tara:strand:- start:8699 stop:9694 length:996 start_codon:yes stop_codon:yes gene_type:complete
MRMAKLSLAFALLFLFIVALILTGYRANIPIDEVVERYWTPYSHWVEVDGSRIHYTVRGEGPSVLLIHGSGSEQGAFSDISEQLASRGFRAIALDLPGSGLSVSGQATEFNNMNNVHLTSNFLDKLNVMPEAIVGHSTGGQVAWTLALEHPDLTDRLVLIAPTGMPVESPLTWRIANIPVLGHLTRWITPTWALRSNLEEAFYDDTKVTEALVERYQNMILRAGARDALFQRMRSVSFARHEELRCITQSVLLLWGKEDIWLPPELANKFESKIPDSTTVLFDDIGHNLPEEASPTEVATTIKSWMASPLDPRPSVCGPNTQTPAVARAVK